jgi:hypothetical protein
MVEGLAGRPFVPSPGAPVRVLAAAGRLSGNAQRDSQGRLARGLPAQSQVLLRVDRPQGESLPMHLDAQRSRWETRLLDARA